VGIDPGNVLLDEEVDSPKRLDDLQGKLKWTSGGGGGGGGGTCDISLDIHEWCASKWNDVWW